MTQCNDICAEETSTQQCMRGIGEQINIDESMNENDFHFLFAFRWLCSQYENVANEKRKLPIAHAYRLLNRSCGYYQFDRIVVILFLSRARLLCAIAIFGNFRIRLGDEKCYCRYVLIHKLHILATIRARIRKYTQVFLFSSLSSFQLFSSLFFYCILSATNKKKIECRPQLIGMSDHWSISLFCWRWRQTTTICR